MTSLDSQQPIMPFIHILTNARIHEEKTDRILINMSKKAVFCFQHQKAVDNKLINSSVAIVSCQEVLLAAEVITLQILMLQIIIINKSF